MDADEVANMVPEVESVPTRDAVEETVRIGDVVREDDSVGDTVTPAVPVTVSETRTIVCVASTDIVDDAEAALDDDWMAETVATENVGCDDGVRCDADGVPDENDDGVDGLLGVVVVETETSTVLVESGETEVGALAEFVADTVALAVATLGVPVVEERGEALENLEELGNAVVVLDRVGELDRRGDAEPV